jgi:hypothetical protein
MDHSETKIAVVGAGKTYVSDADVGLTLRKALPVWSR